MLETMTQALLSLQAPRESKASPLRSAAQRREGRINARQGARQRLSKRCSIGSVATSTAPLCKGA